MRLYSAVFVLFVLGLIFCGACFCAEQTGEGDIISLLEEVRVKYKMPAMAGAVISEGKIAAIGAVGERKAGSGVSVTVEDKFHLGSCTKAMTGTLIGMLVEQGKLTWDLTISEALPGLADQIRAEYRDVTLRQLLEHRAGLPGPEESWPEGKSFMDMHKLPGGPRRQRMAYVKMMLCQEPEVEPGTKYLYSNADYSVVAVIAEEVTKTSWEKLMRKMVFEPLGMKSAGFGAMGSAGRKIDQPWQHRMEGSKVVPVEPGPFSDNPAVIGPGGGVHCSIGDWAKFVMLHLDGGEIINDEILQSLHEPMLGGDYACGWKVNERNWAKGKVFTHTGSNNMNYAVVWMAPECRYAVLVVTNQGGDKATEACDDAVSSLISIYPPSGPRK